MGAATLLGRLSTGWLLDRYFAPKASFCLLSVAALGPDGGSSRADVITARYRAFAESDTYERLLGRSRILIIDATLPFRTGPFHLWVDHSFDNSC